MLVQYSLSSDPYLVSDNPWGKTLCPLSLSDSSHIFIWYTFDIKNKYTLLHSYFPQNESTPLQLDVQCCCTTLKSESLHLCALYPFPSSTPSTCDCRPPAVCISHTHCSTNICCIFLSGESTSVKSLSVLCPSFNLLPSASPSYRSVPIAMT